MRKGARLVLVMAAVAVPCLCLGAAAQEDDVVGKWTAKISGQEVELDLRADGTFSLAGVDGKYEVKPGKNVPDTLHYARVDQVYTGGDFRIAFYTDGTVRAKLEVLNYTPMYSTNEPFCYEGKYTLGESGGLKTDEMPLVNNPETMMEMEKRMTKMRITGRFDREKDRFTVGVESYDPEESRWDMLGEKKALTRAVKRKSYMYGVVENPDIRLGVGGGADD